MSELNKKANGVVELTATVETEAWKAAQEKAFTKLAKNVEIKGFRKGQAPKNLVRQQLSEQHILMEAVDEVAQNLLIASIEEHNVELINRPELDILTINTEECVLKFVCPVKPDVTLGEYKGLGFNVEEAVVTDEEVEAEINKLKEQKAELEIKEEGTVELNDTAVIDFEGFKDGVPFEGGKGENYDLVIGSGSFIPGFEEQLIGMKAEEEKEIEVTFPENYHAEDLKGQAVTFKVKVHEIKSKSLPELDEEMIAELKIENVNTLEELKAYIKDAFLKNRQNENENKATEELLNKVTEAASVEIPEILIENELEDMMRDYEQRFAQQGFTLDQFLQMTNQSKDDIKASMRPDAEKKVKVTLVLEEIAKAENVEVAQEDIEAEFENLANHYGMKTEDIKQYIREDQIRYDLRLRKALDIIKGI